MGLKSLHLCLPPGECLIGSSAWDALGTGSFPLHHPSLFFFLQQLRLARFSVPGRGSSLLSLSCDWGVAPRQQTCGSVKNPGLPLMGWASLCSFGKGGPGLGDLQDAGRAAEWPRARVCVCAPALAPLPAQCGLGREGGRGPVAISFLQTAKLGPISPKPAPVS